MPISAYLTLIVNPPYSHHRQPWHHSLVQCFVSFSIDCITINGPVIILLARKEMAGMARTTAERYIANFNHCNVLQIISGGTFFECHQKQLCARFTVIRQLNHYLTSMQVMRRVWRCIFFGAIQCHTICQKRHRMCQAKMNRETKNQTETDNMPGEGVRESDCVMGILEELFETNQCAV